MFIVREKFLFKVHKKQNESERRQSIVQSKNPLWMSYQNSSLIAHNREHFTMINNNSFSVIIKGFYIFYHRQRLSSFFLSQK